MTVGKEFAFEVGLLARVRVRAANEGNGALWDCDVVVTCVDFFADGKIKLVRRCFRRLRL